MTSTLNRSRTLHPAELHSIAGAAADFLKGKAVSDSERGIAGWHNNFAPGRIGTTGSALPLDFLRAQRAITPTLDTAVIKGLLAAQVRTGRDAGGWCILSLSDRATTEGTAPTLSVVAQSEAPGASEAVASGRAWLVATQRTDGGWGSTADDPARTCLTASAVMTLSNLDCPPREALSRAAQWLRSQQSNDGAWGAGPGASGTIVHTALGLRALAAIDGPQQPECIKALNYLATNWRQSSEFVDSESYDASTVSKDTYNRVILTHDVDAEVILTLLEVDPLGSTVPFWRVVDRWVGDNKSGGWLDTKNRSTTVWTVVQRAKVAQKLGALLGPDTTRIEFNDLGFAMTSESHRRTLVSLALSSFRVRTRWFRPSVFVLAVITASLTIYLRATSFWDWPDAIAGALMPLTLTLLATYGTERPNDA